MEITPVLADITTLEVDAIVNAANPALQGGGGVDGAIHRAAGPELARAGRKLAPCPTGEARTTPAFGLDPPVRFVIHTVGPIWHDHDPEEADRLLASCYRTSLAEADRVGARSVAFPAISAGAYGYPVDEAARVALETATLELPRLPSLQRLTFVLYSDATYQAFRRAREGLRGGWTDSTS